VSKSRETYHTQNAESKETEKRRLRIYLQNQKSRTLEHSWRLKGRYTRLLLKYKIVLKDVPSGGTEFDLEWVEKL